MRRLILALAGLLLCALWVANGLRAQPSIAPVESTVQSQLTAVVQPTPSPTP